MKSSSLIHPLLFGLFPVLFLYSHNTGIVSIGNTVRPALIILGLVLLLYFLLSIIFKNRRKVGLILSLVLVLFFAYGHLRSLMPDLRWHIGSYALYPNTVLLPLWGLVILIGTFLIIRTKSDLLPATKTANVISVLLVLSSILTAVGGMVLGSSDKADERVSAEASEADYRPDIYYFILDGYAGNDVLSEIFDFDNSDFTDYLQDKGFYVAGGSRSNYCQTILSMASSLNYRYLDETAALLGEDSGDRKPLIEMIRNSEARSFLDSYGYDFAAWASGYYATEITGADIYIARPGTISEFEEILLNTTPIPVVMRKMNSRRLHRERVIFTLNNLSRRPESENPLLVFAHVICPHPPFVIDEQGGELTSGDFQLVAQGKNGIWPTGAAEEKNYLRQIAYVNSRLKSVVADLLANSPEPPVIILQGDHGSLFPRDSGGVENPSYREKFSILQALYFPGADSSIFCEDISPLNTFRMVFNNYFGAGLDRLENRSFFSTWDNPYRFIDVTETVSRSDCQPAGSPEK